MPPLLNAFFHPAHSGGQRLYLHHTPPDDVPVRGAVLYLHPWAEEMNKSRRMAALGSRAMASEGWAVLQVDLLGCGDSSGDFSQATWAAWEDDALQAASWLQAQHPQAPLWLWGLRAGGLLAGALLARLPAPPHLLLWQPVLQGKTHLQQFLRLKAAAQLADGGGKTILAAARAELAAGRAVEVAGYTLGAALAQGLESAVLTPYNRPEPCAAQSGPCAAARLVWLETSTQPAPTSTSPASQTAQLAWQAAGWNVTLQAVSGPAFWQTSEIEDAPALIDATMAALTATAPATNEAVAACAPAP